MLVSLVFVSVIAGAALMRAYAELDENFLQEWAEAHGLEITAENRPMVRWYLRNARVLRTLGALAGLFLPVLVAVALGLPADAHLVWVFVGYLLGALYAELSLVRPLPSGKRAASLVPRALTDYLPRELRFTQRALGGIVTAGFVALAAVPFDPPGSLQVRPDLWALAVGSASGLGLAVGLERLQTWIVRRPQPFTDPTLVAADDSIRSQSVHSLSGSGIAIEFLLLSAACFGLAQSDVQILRWTLWVPGFFGMGAALFACQFYGHRAWRVRRRLPTATEKTAPA